ncbi:MULTISPECIES: hypothetical protein [Pseudomonas]|uniref:hypothetical protein n=1 Tax=Pseudomonas TaxID=286 RepID=UPI002187E914|nr:MULTISPECIES: hypothetical protein [Pseudomonas]MDR8364207.1 hypothetical protein [Pseudomonas sp. JL3]URM27150.1 hypothetical protein LLY42_25435 [Pseudomonas frederiksbergensis]WLG92428.1 hypothetical protein PSH72_10220 [Pseudomonas cucumis]
MFRTQDVDLAGLPGMFGEGLTHWHAVSRSLATHWYHVGIKLRHEDRFISQVEMLNDETKLFELISTQGPDLVIDELQVVTPPWINKIGSWRMERLTSVSVGYDKNEIPVCLMEVESGAVYVDVHDPTFDASTLTNLRKIY